ncbi:MAG: cell division protein [Candidatus Symbiopectobacterium sp. Clec_Harlan]|uniref:Cro/CI family transcriptional regulator n=1 Tax=Symbiopectobacterium sp. TaxID=2952789 RepID=UPI001A2DC866|nr:cell division protein [Candidatus Symbiopectobacterium sp. Clec_Harlan]
MTVEQLKSYFGKNKNIAKFYGVTPEAISMWCRRKGRLIPKARAIEAEYRTKGVLKYNPALYENKKKNVIDYFQNSDSVA